VPPGFVKQTSSLSRVVQALISDKPGLTLTKTYKVNPGFALIDLSPTGLQLSSQSSLTLLVNW